MVYYNISYAISGSSKFPTNSLKINHYAMLDQSYLTVAHPIMHRFDWISVMPYYVDM